MKSKRIKVVVLVGVLSSLAFVFYYLEFSVGLIFPAAPYLKMDLSDIPSILGGLAAGPAAGVLIQLVKNVLHFLLITKEPMASGEIANFFAGTAYLLPVVILLKNKSKGSILLYAAGVLSLTVIANLANYFITFPLYGIEGSAERIKLIISTFIPFNILKGILLSFITAFMYSKLKTAIKKYW